MKKITLALSLVAASSLMAANIDLYGQAHLSADAVDNGTNSTTTLASNASRLGVKASADIGKGVTAVLQYEMGVDLSGNGSNDDGNGGDFNANAGNGNNNGFFTSARDSFVGLKSDKYGMLLAGNLPGVNQWMYDYNLFADQVGDLGNIWGSAGIGIDRANSTVAYFIPTVVEGLSGDIAYVSDQNGNTGSSLTGVLVKANYENSGFKVGVGYLAIQNQDSNTSTTLGGDPTDLAITASYSQDNFSIGGGYVKSTNVSGTLHDKDRDAYTAGASYTMNKVTLKAQWAAVSDDVANSDADMIAVGADYALFKDATVYVAYASTSNDTGASYGANGWGHGKSAYGSPVAGQDPSVFSLGLVYKFGGNIYKK
jgi:predicted porin